MKWLERWAWDVIPAVLVAGVLMFLVGLYVKEEARPKTCPMQYGQKVVMEIKQGMLICKYGR